MQTIKPAPRQLFCKPDEPETVTKSGIFIAEKHAEKTKTALIINRGSDVTDFVAGDRIIYKPYATTEIKLDGVEYFLVNEDDVMGTVIEVEE